jgi:hypothetical protein
MLQLPAYGAGTLTTDGSGNVTAASDERLKDIQGTFDRGLADLEKLEPIFYKWKADTGFDATTTYAGFSAQNVQAAVPEAVGHGKDGFLTLQDRPLIATIVNAIKELAGKVSETARLVIDTLISRRVETHELCVDDVCVTRDQFAEVFGNQSAAADAPFSASGAPSGSSASASDTDTTSDTTPSDLVSTAANDNWISDLDSEPLTDDAVDDVADQGPLMDEVLQAANDNPPPLDPTGTQETSTP